jgi:hypothetical protein
MLDLLNWYLDQWLAVSLDKKALPQRCEQGIFI